MYICTMCIIFNFLAMPAFCTSSIHVCSYNIQLKHGDTYVLHQLLICGIYDVYDSRSDTVDSYVVLAVVFDTSSPFPIREHPTNGMYSLIL